MTGKVCECGRPIMRPRCTRCALCRAADPHRNGHRAKKLPEMVVSVDGEGEQSGDDMRMISISYGREDGSRASLSNRNGLTGQQVCRWLIDELSGHYTDPVGKVWRQVPVAFHFQWDSSVISKDFTGDMMLVHRNKARETGLLCATTHVEGDQCTKLHRYNAATIQAVISDGGEGDVIAWHRESQIAIAGTPKRRLYLEHRPNGDRYEERRVLDIHDNGSAFVGGLETVIEKWQPKLTAEQRAAIAWGKQARKEGFLHGTIAQVEEYSEAECVAHARVTRMLLDTIREAAHIVIKPSRLFGSGSVAGAAFKFHQVLTREDTHVEAAKLQGIEVDDLAKLTYFGGLIETPVLGLVVGQVDEVDLNSAYPAQAIRVPCMRAGHGHWERHRRWRPELDPGPGTIGHVLAYWSVDTPSTPPFNVRVPSGLVRNPLSGRAWVTLVEFQAARERFGDDVQCSAVAWWVQDCDCANPLAWLEELYDARQDIKAQMKLVEKGSPEWQRLNVQQEAIKLIINSCYGKLAQQLPELGMYTNLHYAGFITGATRAEVRRETWRREDQGGTVVYQHTDSVLSTGGTPTDGGSALGAWGMEKPSTDLLITQPGLATALGGGKTASRGCRKDDFAVAAEAWAEKQDLTLHPLDWQPMTIPRRMMISRRLAVARGKPHLAGAFLDQPLTVNFASGKRNVEDARQIPGKPTAWIVPPVQAVDQVATLEDIRQYKTELARRIESGDFDDLAPQAVKVVDAIEDQANLERLVRRRQQQKAARDQVAQDYEEAVAGRFEQAETDTRGHMLNRRGRASDVDPRSLFTGQRRRVAAYASEELTKWFEEHGRMTLTDYRKAMRRR